MLCQAAQRARILSLVTGCGDRSSGAQDGAALGARSDHPSGREAEKKLRTQRLDQVQELSCRLFQAARAYYRSRTTLWERLRGRDTEFYIPDWHTLWQSLAQGSVGAVLALDTS
ncbi:MAG: hypothetical protein V2J55_11575 [Candidatus Competibacteraceae bacterium]|nr:hypothetical protein [Candidatus Competibacteraceae bacterium]